MKNLNAWPSTSEVTDIGSGVGIDITGTVKPIISIADTGVSSGTFTAPTININAQGQITSASSNSYVSSVAITGSSGLSVSNSPITSSGTISLNLSTSLQGLSALGALSSSNGWLARIGDNWVFSNITSDDGSLVVTGSAGSFLGGPSIDIKTTTVTPGSYTNCNVAVNKYGQITAASNGSAVTNVEITGGTGLSVTGSPITSSGTIGLTLSSRLQSLSSSSGQGVVVYTGGSGYIHRTFTASSPISISDGDGVLANPTISLNAVGTAGTYAPANITTDTYGRVTSVIQRGVFVITAVGSGTLGAAGFPAGITRAKVTVIGAGGSGGGSASGTTGAGSGGGAGGTCISYLTNLSPSTAYTIGAGGGPAGGGINGSPGGASTFAGVMTANGGEAGNLGSTAASGGSGGTATGGNLLNLRGGGGGAGCPTSLASDPSSGAGGNSSLGGGGRAIKSTASTAGEAGAPNTGAGGSGGVEGGLSGAGALGVIIIEY